MKLHSTVSSCMPIWSPSASAAPPCLREWISETAPVPLSCAASKISNLIDQTAIAGHVMVSPQFDR
eukprot:SAG22_NODE_18816_length_281_cov_0.659341_1_plen_65_part_10